MDAYSKFLDVALTQSISANRTVDLCREIFARYGPPDILVTDHGTQFTSEVFYAFCKEMQCTHLLSAVNHPQSNGQAERMIDTIKRAMANNPSNWRKLFDFLHSYRYTPCAAAPNGKSPAELFFGRRINSLFSKLFPKYEVDESTFENPKQEDMKAQFSKHHGARQRHLNVGDRVVVLIRADKREQGYITQILSNTRYSVHLDSGKEIDRHINHIWRGGSTDVPTSTSEDLVDVDDCELFEPFEAEATVDTPDTEANDQTYPLQAPIPDPLVFVPALPVPAEPPMQPTPARPTRTRAAQRRLVMNPGAKSYTE